MGTDDLSARELQLDDIELIADYWVQADGEHLVGMGVDISKRPARSDIVAALSHQLKKPIGQRQSYGTIWEVGGEPVGHCNVNKIVFGLEAHMHLHLWHASRRHRGLGPALIQCSLPFFFEQLQLQDLYCEPYAMNTAPNRALEKAGFEFVQQYVTLPGAINFVQKVKRWRMSRARYLACVHAERGVG